MVTHFPRLQPGSDLGGALPGAGGRGPVRRGVLGPHDAALHPAQLGLLRRPLLRHRLPQGRLLPLRVRLLRVRAALRVRADADPHLLPLLLPHHHGADVLLWNYLPLAKTQNEKQVMVLTFFIMAGELSNIMVVFFIRV